MGGSSSKTAENDCIEALRDIRLSPEEEAGVRRRLKDGGVEEVAKFIDKNKEDWKKKPFKIGVTGLTGCGKSTFINTMRGLKANEDGAAKVGVNDTTTNPTPYPFPTNPQVVLWDLPAVRSPAFAKNTFLKDIDFGSYDFFLILSDTRFREEDAWLGVEATKIKKKFYYVRTKVDQDTKNELHDHPEESEEQVLQSIRLNIEENLTEYEFSQEPLVFLVSRDFLKYDIDKLRDQLLNDCSDISKLRTQSIEDWENNLRGRRNDEALETKQKVGEGDRRSVEDDCREALDKIGLSVEDEEKARRRLNDGGVEELTKFICEKEEALKRKPFKIGVTGQTGCGKAAFINGILGLATHDNRAARVRVHAAFEPTPYPFPSNPQMVLWDVPAVGSRIFPKSTYLQDIDFESYDLFLILSSSQFREHDVWLGEEAARMGKKFYYVRTKVDHDAGNELHDNPEQSEEQVLESIRSNIEENLKDYELSHTPLVFLVSRDFIKYDIDKLKQQLINDCSEIVKLRTQTIESWKKKPRGRRNDDDRENRQKMDAGGKMINERNCTEALAKIGLSVEDEAEARRRWQEGGVNEFAKFLKDNEEAWKKKRLKIAVTGSTGSGKSTFINTMRDLKSSHRGAAAIGVTETTETPTKYHFPTNPHVEFWDVPGFGTNQFPKSTYLEDIDFGSYDFFLVLSATRFREEDAWLGEEAAKRKKKFYYVRTKVDQDITNELEEHPDRSEEEVLQSIRTNIEGNLKKYKFSHKPLVFLVSKDFIKYEIPKLKEQLKNDSSDIKRDQLVLAFSAITKEELAEKVKVLSKRIWRRAIISAGVNSMRIPLLSEEVDEELLDKELKHYYDQLGLSDEGLRRTAQLTGCDKELLKKVAQKAYPKDLLRARGLLSIGTGAVAGAAAITGLTGGATLPLMIAALVADGLVMAASAAAACRILQESLNNMQKAAEMVAKAAVAKSVKPGSSHDA